MVNKDDGKNIDSSKSLVGSALNYVFGGAGGTPDTENYDPLFFNSSRDTEHTRYKIKSGVGVEKDGGKIHAFKYDCVPHDFSKNKFGAKIEEAIEKIKSAEASKKVPAQYELHSILHVAYEDLVASGTEDMPSFLYLAESAKHAITEDVKNKIGELQHDGGVCLALVTELILSENDLLVTAVEPRPDEDFSPVAALNELYVTKVFESVTSFNETAGVLLNHGVDPNWKWVQDLHEKAPTLDKLAELDYKDLQATIKPDVENPAANQIANDWHEKIVHQLYTGQIGSPSAGPASTVPPTRTYLADNNATLDFISKVEQKMNNGWKDNENSTDNGKKKSLSSMDGKSIDSMLTSLCNDMGVTDRDEKSRLHNIIRSAKEDDVKNKGRPIRRSPLGRSKRGKVRNMAMQKAKSKTTRTMVSKAMSGVGKKVLPEAMMGVGEKALTSAAAKGLLSAGAEGLLGAAGAGAAGMGASELLGAMGGPVGLAVAALPMLIQNGEAQKAMAQEILDQNKAANESAVEQNRNLLQEVQPDLDHSEADAAAKDAMASVQKDPFLQLSTLQGMGLQRLAEALAPDFSPSTMSAMKPYATDAALVAAVDSGRILRAISFFINEDDLITTPRESFLGTPKYVDMMGASMPFTTELHRSTSEEERNSFLNTSTHTSHTVARKSTKTSSRSTSAKGNTWFSAASGEHSNTTTNSEETKETNAKDSKSEETKQKKVKKVFVTEFTYMPVKTVRLNTGGLLLSEFALHQLHHITNINSKEFPDAESQETEKRSRAKQYLKQFGSHIPDGVQTLGGIFIRKMELTSEQEKESSQLYSSALQQLSQIKSNAETKKTSAGGSTGFFGIGASGGTSSSFTNASSSGFTNTNSSGVGQGSASQSRNESYNCEVVCYGPCAADQDTMYQQLMNNNATWAVIDRGEPDHFVPIWKIIDMMGQGTHYDQELKLLREQWEEMALTNASRKHVELMRIIMPNYEAKRAMFEFVEMLAMCFVPLDFKDAAGEFKNVVETAAKAQVGGFFADPSSFISNGFGEGLAQTFRLNEGSKQWHNAKNLMQHIVPHNWNDCVVYQYHQDLVVRKAKPNFFCVMCKEAFNEYEDNLRIAKEQNPKMTDEEVKLLAMDATSPNWESIEEIVNRAQADQVKNVEEWLSFQDEDKNYPLKYAMYSGKETLIKRMYMLYPDAWKGSIPQKLQYTGYDAAEKILDQMAGKPNLHEVQEEEKARKESTLQIGETLTVDEKLISKNGKYAFLVGRDGNLLGFEYNDVIFWQSHTKHKGKGPYILKMQEDGNLVLLGSGEYMWSTGSWKFNGHHCVMQDDRNIVVCDKSGNHVWTSNTKV